MNEEQEQLSEVASELEVRQFHDWAGAQLSSLDLGDERRHKRVIQMLGNMAQRPGQSLPQQCKQSAALKAAYRLLDCPALLAEDISASGGAATIAMLQQRQIAEVLLAVQDTTTLN